MTRASILIWGGILIISCNNSNDIPTGIIKPVQMENILWDMIRGHILAQEIVRKDSAQNLKSATFTISEKIYAIHKTDRIKFEKSLAFYERHPVLMRTVFDSLNALQTKKNSLDINNKRKQPKDYHFSPVNKIQ